MKQLWIRIAICSLVLTSGWMTIPRAHAQLLQDFDLTGPKQQSQVPESELRARLVPVENQERVVRLELTVTIPKGSYTYSTSPAFSGGTKIKIDEATGLAALGKEFTANQQPKKIYQKEFKQEVEKFFQDVTWSREYRLDEGIDPTALKISGKVRYQVCDDTSCTFHNEDFVATWGTDAQIGEPASVPVVYSQTKRPARKTRSGETPDPIELEMKLAPEQAVPGEKVTLSITAKLDEGWHTFALTQNPRHYGLPTEIQLDTTANLKPLGEGFRPSHPPETEDQLNDGKIQLVHHGEITWTREFEVLPEAKENGFGVRGHVKYQVCSNRCLPPLPVEFALGQVPAAKDHNSTPGVGPASPPSSGAPGLLNLDFEIADTSTERGLWFYIVSAFIGGMILNVMPCVLPVLAIKVLSFVQQAGESRGRILALNVAYAAGVIGVFLILASLAVTINLGWGGLFQRPEFNLVMACLVFAMGLSLLGVFEIPVPGMVGSAAGANQREGLTGAFLTGVLATLLATPCSGPFLGITLGWSMQQTPMIVYLVWGVMGLGMAFPYVMFGFFPQAIRFLPKPGQWMVRFKELAGFVLMGTVIFFIYFIDENYVVPLLVMMLGIALGLWMIGNLYDHSTHIRHKNIVRVTAVVLMIGICGFGYSLSRLDTGDSHLPWQDFSEERLTQSLSEGKTVLVDFTADWCLTCKTVETIALNTEKTRKLVDQYGVVPLYADYTDYSDEITAWLERFDSRSVPLTVIFPANRPNRPIIIRDLYTQQTLLDKLQEAVDTPPAVAATTAAVAR